MNNRKLKILIYGEPYEWAMAHNLREAFHQLGHDAVIFDWTQWLFRAQKLTLINRALDRLLISRVAKVINRNFLEALESELFDLVIVLKGLHLFSSTIVEAKQFTSQIVNWNPDDFFNPLNNSRYLLESFEKYDCIFTPRNHLKEEYYKKGAKRIGLLNWYYLPKFQYPVNVSPQEKQKYGSDFVFIGTWSKRREQLIGSLQGFGIKLWGSHWHRATKRFRNRIECKPPVFSEEMCKVICLSKINLNILTKENRDTTNVRNFEIAACSGFQLSERSKEILQLFEEDKAIVCFETPEELVSKCEYYLRNKVERDKIRLNGYNMLLKGNHTMVDRANEILVTLSL